MHPHYSVVADLIPVFHFVSACYLLPQTQSFKTTNLRDKMEQLDNKVADAAVREADAVAKTTGKAEEKFTVIGQVCGLLPHHERRLFTIDFVRRSQYLGMLSL